MSELLPIVVALGEQARANDLALTVDAEESERHDLMLDFFEALGEAPTLKGWSGLGLAVQGYQKRALPTLNWLVDLARRENMTLRQIARHASAANGHRVLVGTPFELTRAAARLKVSW